MICPTLSPERGMDVALGHREVSAALAGAVKHLLSIKPQRADYLASVAYVQAAAEHNARVRELHEMSVLYGVTAEVLEDRSRGTGPGPGLPG